MENINNKKPCTECEFLKLWVEEFKKHKKKENLKCDDIEYVEKYGHKHFDFKICTLKIVPTYQK
jgi:hypothetical protein